MAVKNRCVWQYFIYCVKIADRFVVVLIYLWVLRWLNLFFYYLLILMQLWAVEVEFSFCFLQWRGNLPCVLRDAQILYIATMDYPNLLVFNLEASKLCTHLFQVTVVVYRVTGRLKWLMNFIIYKSKCVVPTGALFKWGPHTIQLSLRPVIWVVYAF